MPFAISSDSSDEPIKRIGVSFFVLTKAVRCLSRSPRTERDVPPSSRKASRKFTEGRLCDSCRYGFFQRDAAR